MSALFSDCFPLKRDRVHEVQGAAATSFAAIAAAQHDGALVWCQEAWRAEGLNPQGLAGFLDPERLLIAKAKDQSQLLAIAEESLRDGAVSLVVMELSKPLNLTAGRRLQLAAKTGHSRGLCLIGEGQGSSAAETRWHCGPKFGAQGSAQNWTEQRWSLIKNKSGILGTWDVRWDWSARRLRLVSAARE
jgi:protein ImuA